MTAKAWYWTGLGVLVLSLGSSHVGRCLLGRTSGFVTEVRAKAVPYMAMAEMALGHTQAGIGHMQSAQARIEAQQARLQAVQARIEANRARLEALSAKRMKVVADVPDMEDFDDDVPAVSVDEDRVEVQGPGAAVVCSRHVGRPAIHVSAPSVSVNVDPI